MSQTVSPSTISVVMAWRGSRARGAFRAPAFITFSRRHHIPIARRRPRSDGPYIRMLTWPIISAGKSEASGTRRRLSQTMGATARCRGSLEALAARAPEMGENRLLAPHRVRRNQEKTHDGTIVTDKVNEMWGTDMSQTVTIEEEGGPMFSSPKSRTHANSEIIGIHAARVQPIASEALEPVRQGAYRCFGSIAPGVARGLKLHCVTIMAPITCPAISRARSNVWASKLRRPSCANPRAMASPSASSEP